MAGPDSIKTLLAMVIDSNSIARHRLKTVCHTLDEFEQVDQSDDFRSAKNRIEGRQSRLDILFISSKFDESEIKEFTDWAKKTSITQDAAFVILMGVNEKGPSADTRSFLMGGDGVLFEPFSTDQLTEMSALAMKVRRDRSQQRLAAHLQGVVNEMFGMLGDINFLKRSNFSFKPVMREIERINSLIEGLEADQTQIYFDVLMERSAKGPPAPHKYPEHFKYPGKSKRTRKRMQRKTLKALGYEATG